jgi:hypothetical protein
MPYGIGLISSVLCDAVVIVGFRPNKKASNLISMHDPFKTLDIDTELAKRFEEFLKVQQVSRFPPTRFQGVPLVEQLEPR